MKFRTALVALFAALALLSLAPLSHAAEPKAGTDYTIYAPPQPTDVAQGKIEITEFFSYGCSHCADMEPHLDQWTKALPPDVSLRRVPVIFRPQMVPAAKLYYTLEALNLVDKLHSAAFIAMHQQRVNLMDEETIFKWIASKGEDAEKFASVYKSFTVSSKVQRADQITRAHNIPGTPALVINGKYFVAQTSHAEQFHIANYLIAKERAALKKK